MGNIRNCRLLAFVLSLFKCVYIISAVFICRERADQDDEAETRESRGVRNQHGRHKTGEVQVSLRAGGSVSRQADSECL